MILQHGEEEIKVKSPKIFLDITGYGVIPLADKEHDVIVFENAEELMGFKEILKRTMKLLDGTARILPSIKEHS